jgi:hypothetical protein
MLIDCDTCAMRGPACADCVVSVLLGAPTAASGVRPELDGAEQAALAVLAGSGLVPPLRLVPIASEGGPATAVEHPADRPGTGRAATG